MSEHPKTFTQRLLEIVEPLIFGRRVVTLAVLALFTVYMGYEASKTRVDAGWIKTVPLQHEYMQTFTKYYKDFGGANTVLIALQIKEDAPLKDIYNEQFLTTIQSVTNEVFFIPGVDRSRVLSLFTPNIRFVEVTEQGLEGSEVVPSDYAPTEEMFQRVRSNVGKANIIGRLVANNQRGAQVVAELLEIDPATGNRLEYQDVAQKLEETRGRIESPKKFLLKLKQDRPPFKAGETVYEVFKDYGVALNAMSFKVQRTPEGESKSETYAFKGYEFTAEETDNPQHQPQIQVNIIGFAKVIGDMTDASFEVGGFFFIALVLTSVLLWLYVGSLKLSMLPMACALVCVVWEFGAISLMGFGLDPFAILVPFLVLSVSVSHGVQYVKSWADEVAKGKTSLDASVYTFRALAIAGTIAILADVAGVATIYFIPIQTIQEMSLNAVFGMLAIIITNKVLMPVWLSYVDLGDIEAFKASQKKRDDLGDGLWKILTQITHRGPAWGILLVCAAASGWALWMYPKLQVGDALVGVPELRPESRYNEDSRRVVANYAIGVDILKIIAEGVPDGCVEYDLMEEVDRFSWRMENTEGVSSVMSLLTYARLVNSGLNEGRLNAELVPRNRDALVAATSLVPTNTGLLNDNCDALALFIFTTDHRATTIEHLFAEIKKFNDENKAAGGRINFALASGNVGVMGASNEVVKDQEIKVVGWVYAIIILFIVLAYRTFSAVVCIIVPLGIVSLLGYAFMAILDIGMKVSTLPVVALAVGIGVDYGIYIYSMIADGIRRKMSLEEAYLDTLRRTGKSVIFIGIALGSTVATWIFSKLQFQVDMGILLVFLFTANMFGAIVILPALAHFFADEEKKHIGKPTLIGH